MVVLFCVHTILRNSDKDLIDVLGVFEKCHDN